MNTFLSLSTEVKAALRNGQPIVALESTLIAHGMPFPQNLETAKALEEIILGQGAVPATIAILGGKLKVGLSAAELEYLASQPNIAKASRRDMAGIVARKEDGATTVAATMIIAAMAGIGIFATGGIGGVHRGAAHTFDISADLQELARTNVAVVCAGVKSMLDIGLTLEHLETHGVPVIGYKTAEFPAFYTRSSGFKVPEQTDTVPALANILATKQGLQLAGGVLIANPIPEEAAMDKAFMDDVIVKALSEADQEGISGKAVTPFLLNRIKQITKGDSLKANISLVKNNADLAAQLATAVAHL